MGIRTHSKKDEEDGSFILRLKHRKVVIKLFIPRICPLGQFVAQFALE